MSVDVLIYQPDGATLIAIVPDVLAVTALEEKDGQGGGSLRVAYDNPALAANPTLLDHRNVVKVRIGGTVRAAWMIRKTDEVLVGAGGEVVRAVEASGPGLLAWLEDAVVYQEAPNDQGGSTRWFGWGSKSGTWYSSSEWGAPVRVAKRGGADFTDPQNRYRNKPLNWPDCKPKAWWVWDRPNANRTAPAGKCYFRYPVYTAEDGTDYGLYLTADNRVDVQIDGEPLSTVRGRRAFKNTYAVDFTLDSGTHILGFRVTNRGGGASLLAALFRYDDTDDDESTGTLVGATGTGTGWVIRSYPTAEPGWTAGEILADLISEADTRGVASVGYLNGDTFTDTTDTDGTAWSEYVIPVNVGDTYWQVAENLRDYDVDLRVNPATLALDAYQVRGSDVSGSVMIAAGSSAVSANEQVESRIVNTVLVADEDEWSTVTDSASVSAHGRTEGFLNLSSLPTRSAAKVADKVLELYALPVEGTTLEYVPQTGAVPWVDFNVGDYVTAPTTGGGYTTRRVISIAVALDTQNAEPVYQVELGALSRDLIERLQRLIDRLSAGASGNLAGKVPSPPGGGDELPYRPTDPVTAPPGDSPWNDPNDPEFNNPDPGDSVDGVFGVGQVNANVARTMVDVWESYGGSFQIALLTGEPTATAGFWDIGSTELTDTGYARKTVSVTSEMSAASGNDPAVRDNIGPLTFDANSSGADWTPITHVALIAANVILSVVPLPSPLVVADGEAAEISEGDLQLTVSSV